MRPEVELEHRPSPKKHHYELREGQQRIVGELAQQQRGHGNARTEHAVERAALGLVKQCSRRAACSKEKEHDPNRSGIERDHGIVLGFADHGAGVDRNNSAALVAGVGSGRAALLALTQFTNTFVKPMALFTREAAGKLIEVF